ncbi:MAG: methyltransferase domain-containing protein [Spirochaetaceae bacterium]|jgi:SAM-dependent methyltransferase|nr:methyltransferase domain-containing protein [Spirochaetaceae bacterium]
MNDTINAENQANWDERAELHVESYGALEFADKPKALSLVVKISAELMAPHLPGGSVSGLDVVHLQCHIGTDSISLARLGADVTGLDFSGKAVAIAASLAARAGLSGQCRFVQARVEDAPAALAGRRFDVVYTSIGVLYWLPDLNAWAAAIAALLKPGGLFFIYEDHPMLYTLDWDEEQGRFFVAYPYFHSKEPITWDGGNDYSSAVKLKHNRSHEWAHSLSEIITVLLDAGLRIESFREHRTMMWKPHQALIQTRGDGDTKDLGIEFALREHPERVPLTFSLAARKPPDSPGN